MPRSHTTTAMTSQTQGNQTNTLIAQFLETKRSPETIRGYKREIERFVDGLELEAQTIDALLAVPFAQMCDHVSTYITQSKKIDPHTHQVTNPRSVNRKLYALSSFFQYLTKKHSYQGNPTRILEPLPVPKKSSTPSPSAREVRKVLAHLKTYRDTGIRQFRNTLLILVMFLLALRRSEAVRLRWSDIDFQAKTLTIIQKGGTEKRLPMPPVLLTQLAEYREHVEASEFIFTNLRNQSAPLTPSTAYNIVCQVIEMIIPDKNLSPHSFRKAFIEQALNRNNDLISIMNASGHGSIEMVKYYDTRDELRINAIHDMGDLMDW